MKFAMLTVMRIRKREREAEALYCVVLSPREGTVRKNCEKVFMV